MKQKLVDIFNKTVPVGTRVEVTRDNGEVLCTVTRGEAFLLGGHTPVVQVVGIAGCYATERVKAVQP